MTRLILIKTWPDNTTAHLYEHLYVTAITNFFRSTGLYEYVDYHYSATTSAAGLISLKLNLYSNRAAVEARKLSELRIDLSPEKISNALYQIAAEKISNLEYAESVVLKDLKEIDKQKWLDLDFSDTIDLRKSPIRRRAIKEHLNLRQFQNFYLDLSIKTPKLPNELAYTYVICRALLDNIYETVSDELGAFFYDISNYSDHQKSGEKRMLRIDRRANIGISDLMEITEKVINQLIRDDFIHKLAEGISRGSYADLSLPDEATLYESYGLVVGKKTWVESAGASVFVKLASRLKITVGTRGRSVSSNITV